MKYPELHASLKQLQKHWKIIRLPYGKNMAYWPPEQQ
jgi:hypothetical protein